MFSKQSSRSNLMQTPKILYSKNFLTNTVSKSSLQRIPINNSQKDQLILKDEIFKNLYVNDEETKIFIKNQIQQVNTRGQPISNFSRIETKNVLNAENNQFINTVLNFSKCYKCNQVVQEKQYFQKCLTCDRIQCQRYKNKKYKEIQCCIGMRNSINKINDCKTNCNSKRRISRLELSVIESLQFKCFELSCKDKIFSHSQYILHLKDHKQQKIAYKCPLGCNQEMAQKQLIQDHILDLSKKQSLNNLNLQDFCQNQQIKCRKCTQQVLVCDLLLHQCFIDDVVRVKNIQQEKIKKVLNTNRETAATPLVSSRKLTHLKDNEEAKTSLSKSSNLNSSQSRFLQQNSRMTSIKGSKQSQQFMILNKNIDTNVLSQEENIYSSTRQYKMDTMSLQKIYSRKPCGIRDIHLTSNSSKTWTNLGLLKINELLQNKKLKLEKLNIIQIPTKWYNQHNIENNESNVYVICGQVNKEQQPEGIVRIISTSGSIYEGQWKNGEPFGWGRSIGPNGKHYEGLHYPGQNVFENIGKDAKLQAIELKF